MRTTRLTRLTPGYTRPTGIAPWPTSSTIHTRFSSNWSPPSPRFRDEQLNDPQRLPWFEGERLTGPSSSATSTKSTSPTCERGWQGSSRQDKRGSHYLRTKRFVKLSMRTHITNSVKRILMGSSFSRHRNVKFHPSVYIPTLQCKISPPFS